MINTESFLLKGILPAVTFERGDNVIEVVRAIRKGGLNVLEIPFRTDFAKEAIRIIRDHFPDMYVGAGTILTPQQILKARDAGAQFALAPGLNARVVAKAHEIDLPFIPGAMTPSEIELAFELGCTIQKLFPAAQAGGIDMLKALNGPYGHTGIRFIPMGGVNLLNMSGFLNLKNVIAIGGSWLATQTLIKDENYEAIRNNVTDALNAAAREGIRK